MKQPDFNDDWHDELQRLQREKRRVNKPLPWEPEGSGLEGLGVKLEDLRDGDGDGAPAQPGAAGAQDS